MVSNSSSSPAGGLGGPSPSFGMLVVELIGEGEGRRVADGVDWLSKNGSLGARGRFAMLVAGETVG